MSSVREFQLSTIMAQTLNYSYEFVWPKLFSSDFGPPVFSWWFSFPRVSVLLLYTPRIIMTGVATPLFQSSSPRL